MDILRCQNNERKKLALGSRADALFEARYLNGLIDYQPQASTWYLERVEKAEDTQISHDTSLPFSREKILDKFWLELLILGLCHSGHFNVSEVVESKPGWGMEVSPSLDMTDDSPWWAYLSPDRDSDEWPEWADEFYGVSDWERFQQFLGLTTKSLILTLKAKSWDGETLMRVARWYLRGRLMEHPQIHRDEYNDFYKDVLIHYVTCLEALLKRSDDKEQIADKLASRGSWLIGRKEDERQEVFRFIKKVYDARSRIVHGAASIESKRPHHLRLREREQTIRRLRDICRCAIACALIVSGMAGTEKYFYGFLEQL